MKTPERAQLESCIKKNEAKLNNFLKKNEGKRFMSYSNKLISILYESYPDSDLSTTLDILHTSLMGNNDFGKWHGEFIPPLSDDSVSSLAFNLSYLIYKNKEEVE